MYSFGDVPDPNPDTVNVMEDLLVDYITSLVRSQLLELVLASHFQYLTSDYESVRLSSRRQHQQRQAQARRRPLRPSQATPQQTALPCRRAPHHGPGAQEGSQYWPRQPR